MSMYWVLAVLAVLVYMFMRANRGAVPPDVQPEQILADASKPSGGRVLLDVRTAHEFAAGHIRGARNIPVAALRGAIDTLRPEAEKEFVVYCEHGPRAAVAARVLMRAGFPRVVHLAGDMDGWRRAGHPLVKGA